MLSFIIIRPVLMDEVVGSGPTRRSKFKSLQLSLCPRLWCVPPPLSPKHTPEVILIANFGDRLIMQSYHTIQFVIQFQFIKPSSCTRWECTSVLEIEFRQ